MQRILITPPDDDVISLDEMKQHLRVEDSEQDTLIDALITAVLSTLDPGAEGGLGRALRPQTWELQLDGFWHHAWHHQDISRERYSHRNSCHIELPFPPLISIVSVKYDDTAGVEQTLTEGPGYQVIGLGGRSKQSIAPPYLGFWPLARCNPGSVRIRYECGYPVPATDSDPDGLPGGIKAYVKLMVADLFANREGSDLPVRVAIENPNLSRLLDPHRVY